MAGIKISELTRQTTASDTIEFAANINGETKKINLGDAINSFLLELASTQIVAGGVVSKESDTQIKITAGTAEFVNNYSATYSRKRISWNEELFTAPTTDGEYWIALQYINDLLEPLAIPDPFSVVQMRNFVIIGKINVRNSIVGFASTFHVNSKAPISRLNALALIASPQNFQGNDIIPVNAQTSLQLMRTAGKTFRLGSNALQYENDPENNIQDITNDEAENPLNFAYQYKQNGSWISEPLTNSVNPNTYSNNGTKTNVPNNYWTIHRFYMFNGLNPTTGKPAVTAIMPTKVYKKFDEAFLGYQQDTFELSSNVSQNAVFRAVFFVKQGITNFSDANDFKLFAASQAITSIGGTGFVSAANTLKQLIDNSSLPTYTNVLAATTAGLVSGDYFIATGLVPGVKLIAQIP